MRQLAWAMAALLLTGLLAAPADAAQGPGSEPVVVAGPTTWVDHGTRVNGSCVNSSPVLSLAPGQYSVSATVTGADASTCSVTWQIGAATTVRAADPARPAGGSSVEEPAKVVAVPPVTAPGAVSPAATYSGSGYERACWRTSSGWS